MISALLRPGQDRRFPSLTVFRWKTAGTPRFCGPFLMVWKFTVKNRENGENREHGESSVYGTVVPIAGANRGSGLPAARYRLIVACKFGHIQCR